MYHPSFRAVGGAELLAMAEVRALRSHGVNARIVTGSVDQGRWRNELHGISIEEYQRHSRLSAFPWTTAARMRAAAGPAKALLIDSDVVIAHNYSCNAMLGTMELEAVCLWQINEPPRPLYLAETSPVLTARARAMGNSATDWLTTDFLQRLSKWEARRARGGRLGAKRKFDGEMTAKLNGLYAISRYSQTMAQQIYGRCSNTIVYPAVREVKGRAQQRRGIRRTGLQVLVQSRLEPVKNIETVLRGFAAFAAAHSGAHMHVVGMGADSSRLRSIASTVAHEHVTFHDFLEESRLEELAAGCDVFALLPVDEPFGMVFTEAITRGLLCIGPNHGGPNEILESGTFGWTVDAFSPAAVTQALGEIMLMHDDDADNFRAVALASVQRRFSTDAMFQSLRTVLAEHNVVI